MQNPKNMKEIARILGISTVSVSLALRNSPRVSGELKERVLKLAESCNFKTRDYPRSRSRKDNIKRLKIAVLYREDNTDSVAPTILNAVMKRLAEKDVGFNVLSCSEALSDPFLSTTFDGFLYYYNLDEADLPLLGNKPQVAIMNDYFDCSNFDNCKVHNELAGKMAADYLLERGFHRILTVWEEISTGEKQDCHPRMRGFRERLAKSDVSITPIHFSRKKDIAPFVQALKEELDRSDKPLGIFAFNDLTAFQVCSVLDLLGRRLESGKLEMICCDNTFLLKQLSTPIPVIDLHIEKVAAAAVDRLIYRFQNPEENFVEILFKPNLVLPSVNLSSSKC